MTERPAPAFTLDSWPHPLTDEGRVTRRLVLRGGETVAALAAAEAQRLGLPRDHVGIAVNGRILPPEAWAATQLRGGDIVTFRVVPAGGDGARLALLAAVAVASIVIPGAQVLALTGIEAALASAAISIGGGLLVNALVPPELPSAGDAADPLYGLTTGSNRARPYEPLALVLGRHRVFPDLLSQPYTESEDQDQQLLMALGLGIGDIEVEELRIGETLADKLEGVTTQFARAGEPLDLAGANVDTQGGPGEIEDQDWRGLETPDGTVRAALDLVHFLGVSKDSSGSAASYRLEVHWRWRPADSNSAWNTDMRTLEGGRTQRRDTIRIDLAPAGRWRIEFRRGRGRADRTGEIHDDLSWTALRSYRDVEPADAAIQARIGLELTASGQLSGRVERVSALLRQRVPVVAGGAWTADGDRRPTSNPAAIMRAFARGWRDGDERLLAGVGLADERIDHDGLARWHAWCETRGLGCDLAIQRPRSAEEVLGIIARCGRASISWRTGRLGVVWDDPATPVSALVTPGNIVKGSFRVEWASTRPADEIVARWTDPDSSWEQVVLRRRRPGLVGAPARTAEIALSGVTRAAQAAAEINLQAARETLHRVRWVWEMGPEGLTLGRGDVAMISHGLIDGGQTGRCVALDGAAVTLDREVDPGRGEAWLALRPADGAAIHLSLARRAVPGGSGPTAALVLDEPVPGPAPAQPRDVLWRLYDSTRTPQRARIVAFEALSDRRFRLAAIPELTTYHEAADADPDAPIVAPARREPQVIAANVAESLVRIGRGYATELDLILTVAGDWRGGVVTMTAGDEPARTVAVLTDGATRARWSAPSSGEAAITITPGGLGVPLGPAFRVSHFITGLSVPPSAPRGFRVDVSGDGTRLWSWMPAPEVDVLGYEIRFAPHDDGGTEPEWDAMRPLHAGLLTASPYETITPGRGRWTVALRGVDAAGQRSAETRILADLGRERQGNALIWRCPPDDGWPGAIGDGLVSDDGRDVIEAAAADAAWTAAPAAWDDWPVWALGPSGEAALTYTAPAEDLGLKATFGIDWTARDREQVTLEIRTGAGRAALNTAPWRVAATAADPVTARWIQPRWTARADAGAVARLAGLTWWLAAPTATRRLHDIDTATLEGSAADGRVVDTDLARVTDVALTFQDVGAGWTWSLASKSPPTIRIFDGDGSPADAVVDITLSGLEAR